MTGVKKDKCPFPWFGGKSAAAPVIWDAFGDVDHYVEPFAGSLAVLLLRPHTANRSYHSETVNDADGLLVNAWRSIQMSPDATADAASWPVAEADLMARHLAILRWRSEREVERLMADPLYHDPMIAGWWLWGQSSWIGSGWCSGSGPWVVGDDGRITKQASCSSREEGVSRRRPHLGDNGQGVNHAGTREEGVSRRLPHLTGGGRGVNRPQLREDGVWRQLPYLTGDGKGVNHAVTREEGVCRQLPYLAGDGQGVNHAGTREEGVALDREFHPMTMPELREWMRFLSARLRHVRVLNGDWTRACTGGAMKTIPVRMSGGKCGVFLDPPYSGDVREKNIYSHEDHDIATEVRAWCVANGDDSDLRIALAGFDSEHGELRDNGWREVEWFKAGFLTGGMGNIAKDGTTHQQKRERIWFSPHCLVPATSNQMELFV